VSDGKSAMTTLRDGLQVLFLERTKIVAVFVLTVLIAAVAVYVWPESYETESKVLVKMGREIAEAPDVLNRGSMLVQLSQNYVNTEIQILKNRGLVEQVVQKIEFDEPDPTRRLSYPPQPSSARESFRARFRAPFKWAGRRVAGLAELVGLKSSLGGREYWVEKIYKNLSCEPAQESNIILVKLRWNNPVVAPRILDEIIAHYQARHLEVYSSPRTEQAFAREAADKERLLSENEEALAKFKTDNEIFQLETQREMLLSNRSNTEAAYQANKEQIAGVMAELALVEERLEGMPPIVEVQSVSVRNPARDHLDIVITELRGQRVKLATEFTENSPLVRSVDLQIAAAEELRDKEPEERPRSRTVEQNQPRLDLESKQISLQQSVAGLLAREAEFQATLAAYDEGLERLNANEAELSRRMREISQLKEEQQDASRRAQNAAMTNKMDQERISSIEVAEDATLPSAPVSPRRLLTILLALIFGLLLGVGCGLFDYYLDRSVMLPEHVEETGVSFLAAMPEEGKGLLRRL